MPITITPAPPHGIVGPGVFVEWTSDFIGPLPSDASVNVQIYADSEDSQLVYSQSALTQVKTGALQMYAYPAGHFSQGTYILRDGDTAYLHVVLNSGTTVIDSGHAQGTFDSTAGAPMNLRAQLQGQASSGGGLTDEQAAQLAAVDARTTLIGEPGDLVVQTPLGPLPTTLGQIFSRKTLDQLTLDELTSGETFDPVRASFSGWYFGVIVRVTTIDPTLAPHTPDLEWFFVDLAVLRIFRGADLEFRRGIHTPTFMQERPWQWGAQILNETDVLGVPPDMTIAVDWRLGCGGQVFLQRLP